MESELFLNIFSHSLNREHTINRNNLSLPFVIQLLVQLNHGPCLVLKRFHPQLNSLRVIIRPSTGLSSFDQPFNQNLVVAFNKQQTLDFEL